MNRLTYFTNVVPAEQRQAAETMVLACWECRSTLHGVSALVDIDTDAILCRSCGEKPEEAMRKGRKIVLAQYNSLWVVYLDGEAQIGPSSYVFAHDRFVNLCLEIAIS